MAYWTMGVSWWSTSYHLAPNCLVSNMQLSLCQGESWANSNHSQKPLLILCHELVSILLNHFICTLVINFCTHTRVLPLLTHFGQLLWHATHLLTHTALLNVYLFTVPVFDIVTSLLPNGAKRDMNLSQQWLMWWLVARRKQVITCTNDDLSSAKSSYIHLRTISEKMPKPRTIKIFMQIICLKFHFHFLWAYVLTPLQKTVTVVLVWRTVFIHSRATFISIVKAAIFYVWSFFSCWVSVIQRSNCH